MKKTITIIINPASGKKDSILWSINNAFQKKDIAWDVQITQAKGEAYDLAQKAVKQKQHVVAVYGGDGTIAEVAQALYKSESALFVIPGGTNNVFAKELGIPTDTDQALALLTHEKHNVKTIDMGLFQKKPFVLRIETGLLAHMVKNTKRSSKRLLGQLSYLVHLFPHLRKNTSQLYKMQIDDKEITLPGVALMIANVGNIGIEGYSVIPQSKVNDGMLDVILFTEKSFASFFEWVKSLVTRKKTGELIQHWKAKKVHVTFAKEQTIICDDQSLQAKSLDVEIIPQSLKVVVP